MSLLNRRSMMNMEDEAMSEAKLLVDRILAEDGEQPLIIDTDDNGNTFECREKFYYRADIVFSDTESRTIGVTSCGNTQLNGLISPANITGVTVEKVSICGMLERVVDNQYIFHQQYRVKDCAYRANSNTAYGALDRGVLLEGEEGKYPTDLRFWIMRNDTTKFAAGTRIRIWGC